MMKLRLKLIKILSLKNYKTPIDSLIYPHGNDKENM